MSIEFKEGDRVLGFWFVDCSPPEVAFAEGRRCCDLMMAAWKSSDGVIKAEGRFRYHHPIGTGHFDELFPDERSWFAFPTSACGCETEIVRVCEEMAVLVSQRWGGTPISRSGPMSLKKFVKWIRRQDFTALAA